MSEKWYQVSGNEGDVVISTRIRLARNLQGLPFPDSLTNEQREETVTRIRDTLTELPSGGFTFVDMKELPHPIACSLVEKHLISPEFSAGKAGTALLLSADESVSVMVNEEDHLRMQVMRAGLDLDAAYQAADELDSALNVKLHFAFDDRLGYLTQCPTNLGTGMRASVMLHLPALQASGAIQQLAGTVSKLGLTIRGLYGEGTEPQGAIYQLSNQVTLGISEKAAIENLKGIAVQIIREERGERKRWREDPHFADRIWRSLGILRTARLLSSEEFMTLISNVRIGVSLALLPEVSLDKISGLINEVQPYTLMVKAGKEMDAAGRDEIRATFVRNKLQ